MRRFTLPLVILGAVLLAALLTWIALSNVTFAPRGSARGADAPVTTATGTATGIAATTQALPPFRRIDVAGNAEVTLIQGDRESMATAASGDRAFAAATVRDGTLHIEIGDDAGWWGSLLGRDGDRTPRITVTFRDLEGVALAGAVKVKADRLHTPALEISGAGGTSIAIGALATESLAVSGAGALRADLSGTATTQTVSISGAGEYRAPELVSRDATVTVAGAGKVVVHATRRLKATISGAGEVEYLGNPEVTERVSGIGRVRQRSARVELAPPASAG